MEDLFVYGNCKRVDLHGLSVEEARCELIFNVENADNIDGLIIIHGYRGGNALKNLVRNDFKNPRIEKIVKLDAGVTAFKLKKL